MINEANANFMEIPSHIREKFGNDAGRFFEFVTDPKNEKELVMMGLAKNKEVPIKQEESVSAPPAPQEAEE